MTDAQIEKVQQELNRIGDNIAAPLHAGHLSLLGLIIGLSTVLLFIPLAILAKLDSLTMTVFMVAYIFIGTGIIKELVKYSENGEFEIEEAE
jgi:hypothetical protein